MSTKIWFEVQVEDARARHGWRAVGGRDGRLHLTEDRCVNTITRTAEEARQAARKVRQHFKRSWLAGELRVVRVEVVTTYEVVE